MIKENILIDNVVFDLYLFTTQGDDAVCFLVYDDVVIYDEIYNYILPEKALERFKAEIKESVVGFQLSEDNDVLKICNILNKGKVKSYKINNKIFIVR